MNRYDSTESTLFTSNTIIEAVTRQQYPAGTLYVVATPIGNIADISLRALHLLSLVDAVACEDTRNTAQLFSRYGINKPLIAAHQHNEREVAEKFWRACKRANVLRWCLTPVRRGFLIPAQKSLKC
jgi:16S rRNA (cytidine1402-2'-O)-methyltransferase